MGNVHYVGAEPLTFERIEEILTGNMKLELTPEVKERIFVPFFTTKPNGSGIGLSLCRQIVSLHGGRIYVESAPGKGSRFIVEF